MLVFRRHQAGNEDPRQVDSAEAVLGKENRLLRAVDCALELKSALAPAAKKRPDFLRSFRRKMRWSLSMMTSENSDRCSRALRADQACRRIPVNESDSPLPRTVVARVLNGAARTVKRGLAGGEIRRQTDGRKVGQRDGTAGNASSPLDHFKTKPISKVVTIRLMHLDKYIITYFVL